MLNLSDLRPTLIAGPVRLEPLTAEHRDGLARAADHAEIWAHMPHDASGAGFDAWFDHSLKLALAGREAVWAVRTDGALVGSTRYLAIEPEHRRLEIGHTWYAPQVWAGRVNPACKLALLRYAFESLGFNRVELKTDNRNLRSQAAIAKLGANREGVFRAHMVRRDGSLRDSVYFSIVRDEWPEVRDRLTTRLAQPTAQAAE
ncbi:MAG TPA: GNAT family protein [Caulobacteraceae bacterium]|nr:GNAT family protein [Caulobacteraceae bacterium]